MDGILNEQTETIHKRETAAPELRTICGVTHHVDADQLRETSVERAAAHHDVTKCGRCFDDGNGY